MSYGLPQKVYNYGLLSANFVTLSISCILGLDKLYFLISKTQDFNSFDRELICPIIYEEY